MNISFIPTPNWFLAPDVLINAFSFLVLLAFFILCVRNYKINKSKGILYLGIGFAFIAFAQLAIVMTKFVIYYNTTLTTYIGNMIIQYNIVKSVTSVYNISFFINRLFTLIGLYVIYRLPAKKKSITDFILVLYFIVLSAVIGDEIYYLFHATALVLFLLIAYNYYTIYKKNHFNNTKILSIAFGILAISQVLPLISQTNIIGVIADIVELISYVTLLVLILRILKHGKKKKPDGYYLRHAQYHPGARRRN